MPQDTPIEFQNNCLFQANAVELTNGVIVFDCCGRCESCARHSLTDGVAARDEAKAFRMASQEEIMRQQTAIETWTAAKHKEHTQMPQDTPIEFQNNCLFQANAVELTNGVIVFDCCGRCESCARHSLTDGVAARDEAKAFRMASQEEIMRQQTAIETWTNWPWS